MNKPVQKLRSVLKRIWGDVIPPGVGEIKEPNIKDVLSVCCGPRLFTKALELHGEDVSEKTKQDRSEG